MSDDLTKKQPIDASKINLRQKYEIDYWTKVLNTTELKLIFAIAVVGNSVTAVKEYLRNH